MRLIGSLLFAFVVLVCFNSCFEAPKFPASPEIEFNNIIFKKGVKTNKVPFPADTLALTINFKDGDGDLGLDPSDSSFNFANRYYFQFPDRTYITYKTKRTVTGYDTLPDFVTPYTCTNWEIIYQDSVNTLIPKDTLYFQLNPNYYNIFIDIYVQQNDGTFQKFDWIKEFCIASGLNGRFPVLSKDLSQPTVQEGKIRYSMPSAGWLFTFSIKNLKIEVSIQDRARHRSNVVRTPAFTLQSIMK